VDILYYHMKEREKDIKKKWYDIEDDNKPLHDN
jgi:hypothetical protein